MSLKATARKPGLGKSWGPGGLSWPPDSAFSLCPLHGFVLPLSLPSVHSVPVSAEQHSPQACGFCVFFLDLLFDLVVHIFQ